MPKAPPNPSFDLGAELIANGKPETVIVENLGPEGAFVRSRSSYTLGASVHLRFEIGNFPLAFDITAEIKWIREGAGIGLAFQSLSGFDRGALDDFCQWCLQKKGGSTGDA